MFRLATYIVTALVIVFLMVSRVDGGMIYASAYSDALNIRRSPPLEAFSPSSETSLLPILPAAIPTSNMLGTASLSAPGVVSGLLDVEDPATTLQGEISEALADRINASALEGGQAPWRESYSVFFKPSGGTYAETWQESTLDGTLTLTPHVYFATSKSSIELPTGVGLNDYAWWSGQLQLETPRDQAPVITAVDRYAIALVAALPKNDTPNRLPQDRFPHDAMLTPTVTEVVKRMLRDSDDEQSLNARDEIPRIATSRG